MDIVVIGAGYVGLVTAAILAELGHTVTCVESHPQRLKVLERGGVPIHEPGLEPMLAKSIEENRLFFTADVEAVRSAEVVYLAVGTPQGAEGATDLTQIDRAAAQIAPLLRDDAVVVVKSTVPVGTGDRVQAILRRHRGRRATPAVVSNPEFLREGSAVEDARFPDRVVIGANDDAAGEIVKSLLSGLDTRFVMTDRRSSELIKYTANAFLATRISFANTISQLCDQLSANVDDVMLGAGLDHRVGTHFFKPGLGFGGSCFPKDVASLIHEGRHAQVDMSLLESVVDVNETLTGRFVDRIERELGSLQGLEIAVLGLAFKGDTDDVRESRAFPLIRDLISRGARIRAYDPEAMDNAWDELCDVPITYGVSAVHTCQGVDAVVIATDWKCFAEIPWEVVAYQMAGNIVFDGRNLLDPETLQAAGLRYVGVGRPSKATISIRKAA